MNKKNNKLDDKTLIDKYLSGDITYDFIYKRYEKMCKNSLYKKGADIDIANDIYQEAMIVFYNKIKYENIILSCKISTYLYSIVSNLWLKEISRNKKFVESNTSSLTMKKEEDFIKLNHTINDKLSYEMVYQEEDIKIQLLKNFVSKLSLTQQKLFNLHLEDFDTDEIKTNMGYKNLDSLKTNKYKLFKIIKENVKQ